MAVDIIRYGNVYMTVTDMERGLPLYLNCIGKWANQYPIERKEGFPEYQWIQCTAGQGILEMGNVRLTVGPGQGMLLFPHVPHQYYAHIEPWEVRWVAFNGTCAEMILRSFQFEESCVITLSNPDPTLKLLYELIAVAESVDPLKNLTCSSMLYNLLVELYRYGFNLDQRSKQRAFDQLAPALRFIESRSHTPISLDDIAGKLSVTPQHTCVLFQHALGMRPFEYITGVRLRKAKELLLRFPELSVAEVGRKAGYDSTSYFIKLFKREEGITPKAFRRQFLNR